MVKALAEKTPDIRYYPNFAVDNSLDTWIFKDRITLIGDAAHAHGGAYATGGSLAIDDAYALSLSISSVFNQVDTNGPSVARIQTALKLYERTRKPHADKLLELVHNRNKNKVVHTGGLISSDSLTRRAAERPDTVWLHEHDVVEAFNNAVQERKLNS
jgi:salicylate hydroxylase